MKILCASCKTKPRKIFWEWGRCRCGLLNVKHTGPRLSDIAGIAGDYIMEKKK
jgi:hypothetical protein